MSIPKRSIHDSGLLIECQTGSMAVGCVSEQVPCAAVEAKRAYIRPGVVGRSVACFALCEGYIPRARHGLVPLWARHCEGECEQNSAHSTT
jgi:hypothetical protein